MKQVTKPTRVVIVGTGFVGSSFAYALAQAGLVSEIVLIDIDRKKAEGEAMDINHGIEFVAPVKVWAGDYSDVKDADVIVITAGVNQKPGETRLDLTRTNSRITKDVCSEIVKYTKDAIIVMTANPVDILTYVTLKETGYPPNQVIGSGTLLDTARFRFLLGQHLELIPAAFTHTSSENTATASCLSGRQQQLVESPSTSSVTSILLTSARRL